MGVELTLFEFGLEAVELFGGVGAELFEEELAAGVFLLEEEAVGGGVAADDFEELGEVVGGGAAAGLGVVAHVCYDR